MILEDTQPDVGQFAEMTNIFREAQIPDVRSSSRDPNASQLKPLRGSRKAS
jgi:hypothetical protein